MSNPHPRVSGLLALLCLTDFYASDMNWPLLMAHDIFRIKDSLLKHEIREDWGEKNGHFSRECFSKMTLGDVLNLKSQVKCNLQKHKGFDNKVHKQRKAPLSEWDCVKMHHKAFACWPHSLS